nr:MAG TPA: restriction alleviation protein [Caudoviricetes sp.]
MTKITDCRYCGLEPHVRHFYFVYTFLHFSRKHSD